MLKKHIRTHSNDRPYTCTHCNFRYCMFFKTKQKAVGIGWHCFSCSFKTKGNLTKHMKSKSHTKNYYVKSAASSNSGSSSSSSAQQSESESGDESEMESSGECQGILSSMKNSAENRVKLSHWDPPNRFLNNRSFKIQSHNFNNHVVSSRNFSYVTGNWTGEYGDMVNSWTAVMLW